MGNIQDDRKYTKRITCSKMYEAKACTFLHTPTYVPVMTIMTKEIGNGSKVDVLPRNTCSRKYIWNLKVIVAKQRNKAYDPLSTQTDYVFYRDLA